MTRTWIKQPLAIVADGAAGGVVVADDRIVELVPAGGVPATPVDAVFDAWRHVVLPGLVNTHHHTYQTLTRAVPAVLDQPLFGWLEGLYPIWARLTPEALEPAFRLAFAELLESGCTTAVDHHYVFPAGTENAIDLEVEVARDLGLRVVLTRGSMDLSSDDGGLPPPAVTQSAEVVLRDSERLISRHHQPGSGAMCQIALAPCSPFSVTRWLLEETAALASLHGVRLHTHLAETADEERFCLERYGCRPVDYLDACGWLGPRTWVAHGIHFAAEEIIRLGRAGVGVAHCPSANLVLGSGICPVLALEAAGAPVGLAVDGSASNDHSNLAAEVRLAFLLQRLAAGVERVGHLDALRWATAGGAACLGRTDIGGLEVGRQADLALFDMDALRFAGARDPLAALVRSGFDRADRVMVAGRWVVENGAVVGLDRAALVDRHRRAAATLVAA
ncbi:MAG: 8-oxoguanine deaminase [Pseudomonadota bacterium]